MYVSNSNEKCVTEGIRNQNEKAVRLSPPATNTRRTLQHYKVLQHSLPASFPLASWNARRFHYVI